MGVFDSLGETTDRATDIGEKFLNTSHQYFKLKIFQQIAISVSMIAKIFAIGSLIFIGITFFSVAGAIAIGNALGSIVLGCLVVGFIFLLIGLIVYFTREAINRMVLQKLSSKFFAEEKEDVKRKLEINDDELEDMVDNVDIEIVEPIEKQTL